MSDTLITVDNASKKFCRSLKQSLWYGVKDLGAELTARSNGHSDLRKHEFWALKDVSFKLKRGETLGLIGPNGAGKTTLLRMLNGLIKPDEGHIKINGRMQALIALGAGFNPILTGRENIYVNAAVLGIPKTEVDRTLCEIVEFSGIEDFIDAPLQSYSSGMVVRLGFAVAAHLNPDILLVDEVLAVGDEGFQMKCLNKIGELKTNGTAIILVSHNMHTISTYSDRILVMSSCTHELFTDVSAGIRTYRSLVNSAGSEANIEKHCSGAEGIEFYKVDILRTEIKLGEDFRLRLHYRSNVTLEDVEVDVTLRVSGEAQLHHQCTNLTFGKRVDLIAGDGWLDIVVRNLRVMQPHGWFGVAVWRHGREGYLFWWRIPVQFTAAVRGGGAALYDTDFANHPQCPTRVAHNTGVTPNPPS